MVAKGLRQPWQLTFVKGNPNPFVSVLADERNPTPPDWIVNAKPGQDYGYPTCTQAVKKDCHGFAKPVALFETTPRRWASTRSGRRSTWRCSAASRRATRS